MRRELPPQGNIGARSGELATEIYRQIRAQVTMCARNYAENHNRLIDYDQLLRFRDALIVQFVSRMSEDKLSAISSTGGICAEVDAFKEAYILEYGETSDINLEDMDRIHRLSIIRALKRDVTISENLTSKYSIDEAYEKEMAPHMGMPSLDVFSSTPQIEDLFDCDDLDANELEEIGEQKQDINLSTVHM